LKLNKDQIDISEIDLDESNFEVIILPAEEREQEEDFNPNSLSLSFIVNVVGDNEIAIKIIWDDNFGISTKTT
jgi:hypothetical protein